MVKQYCLKNNIQQSFSKPGKSTDNRWIEYFWGSMRIEFTNHLEIDNMSFSQIQKLIDEYMEYWNNQRPIKKLNYLAPRQVVKH